MAPQKTAPEGDVPVRQVNNMLQSLRGEHFRHARNTQGKPVSSSNSLSAHAHNQPTLPTNLIYPSRAPETSAPWVPGPDPPRSWRSSATSAPAQSTSSPWVPGPNNTAWRERAFSPLFSADFAPPSSCARSRPIYPDPSPIPQLTLLCLQLIRATCSGTDLAHVVPHIPLHLRRALLRYTAVHAPLSQTELDALCDGTAHVDTELIVVGPHSALRGSAFRRTDHAANKLARKDGSDDDDDNAWDAVQTQDNEPLVLRSLAVLSSPLSAATMLAFPPTITHLVLVGIPHRVPLRRLPAICPLLVFLDLSYNTWLSPFEFVDGGLSMLEEVGWGKLRRLKVIVLRECLVTRNVLLELKRGRWEDVKVIQ